jgi:hypothetical protein
MRNDMKNDVPSWGSNQGRYGEEDRPPMRRGDLGLVAALWLGSWLAVALICVIYQGIT